MVDANERSPAAAGTDGDDPRVCFCMRVPRSAIVAAIRAGARDVETLRERTRACTGCGTCRVDLVRLLAEHARS